MDNNTKIEIGDFVTFRFDNSPPIYGEVLYKPQDTGDCWRVKTEAGKFEKAHVYYIQNFSFAEKELE